MFKTAAKKLAHNSTIPALAGNSRLQPLQKAIAAEKVVLQSYVLSPAQAALIPIPRFFSLQKLSADFSKSFEVLNAWAISEGEDLEVGPTVSPPPACKHQSGHSRICFPHARR